MRKLQALVLAFIRADHIREPMMAIENIKQKDLNSISKLQSIGITVDFYEPSFKEELDIYYDSIKKTVGGKHSVMIYISMVQRINCIDNQ